MISSPELQLIGDKPARGVKLPIAIRKETNKKLIKQNDIIWPQQSRNCNIDCICPVCYLQVFPRKGKHVDHFFHKCASECSGLTTSKKQGGKGGEGVLHFFCKVMLVAKIKEAIFDTNCMACGVLVEKHRFDNHTAEAEMEIDVAVYDREKQLVAIVKVYDSQRIGDVKQKELENRCCIVLEVSASDVLAFATDDSPAEERLHLKNKLSHMCTSCTEARDGALRAEQKKQLEQIKERHRLDEITKQRELKAAEERKRLQDRLELETIRQEKEIARREASRTNCHSCDCIFYPDQPWKKRCFSCYTEERNQEWQAQLQHEKRCKEAEEAEDKRLQCELEARLKKESEDAAEKIRAEQADAARALREQNERCWMCTEHEEGMQVFRAEHWGTSGKLYCCSKCLWNTSICMCGSPKLACAEACKPVIPCSNCRKHECNSRMLSVGYTSCWSCYAQRPGQACWLCKKTPRGMRLYANGFRCCVDCLPVTSTCSCGHPMDMGANDCNPCIYEKKRQLQLKTEDTTTIKRIKSH